jgi:hypothetical protein
MKIIYIIIFLMLSYQIYSQMYMELNSGVTTQLNSSSNCKPGSVGPGGWACGMNGVVIKSSTGSGGWINVSGNGLPSNINFTNICAVDAETAFITGSLNSNTWVWRTTNGGSNWFQVFTQPNGFINAVWMKNNLRGILEGNPVNGRWSLWKTTNGGINWDSSGLYLPQSGSETGLPNSLCMPFSYYSLNDSNKIWFGTNNSHIYYSSNYGQNWTIQSTAPEQNIYCIAYGWLGSVCLFAGGNNHLVKSTNYGSNWIIDSVGGSGNIVGITYCAWSFYAARGNKLYQPGSIYGYTAPSGNYTYIDNRGFGEWVDHYAVRSNGGITFLTEGEGIKKISNEISNSYSLSQNYPNPFNPTTKIRFQIPLNKGGGFSRGLFTRLTIYDLLGREVAILVNEQLKPGTYEVEWDGTNYPSGVYFYKLTTESFNQTKRMVLIK